MGGYFCVLKRGGSPYGAFTVTGGDGTQPRSRNALENAGFQGPPASMACM